MMGVHTKEESLKEGREEGQVELVLQMLVLKFVPWLRVFNKYLNIIFSRQGWGFYFFVSVMLSALYFSQPFCVGTMRQINCDTALPLAGATIA